MRKVALSILLVCVPMLVGFPNLAQNPLLSNKGGVTGHEFTFARLEYPGFRRGRGASWMTDWPKADEQFVIGLRGWVQSLLAVDRPTTVAIHDPRLFTYPFVYIVEPGGMNLAEDDAKKLREYLDRGGFIMLDDFWGDWEWENVRVQLNKILPDRSIRRMNMDHPVFHCYFDITEALQVPNYHNWIYNHQTSEQGAVVPYFEGIEDENGRLLVFIARNSDNGDAWEWIDQPDYPLRFGLAAYRLGMNVIVYSMTH
jgi:hypothetical protein